MEAEEVQELGREGVGMVKAWLESTTWMSLPMNAYQDGKRRCAVAYPGGSKVFDLSGYLHGDKSQRRNIWVECKRYSSEGVQHREFKKVLSIAYSYHCKQVAELGECDDEFLWVTSHPFYVSGWTDLATEEKVDESFHLPEHSSIIGNLSYDNSIGQSIASRVWVLVWSEKQIQKLTLSSEELAQTMTVLTRGGRPLWSH